MHRCERKCLQSSDTKPTMEVSRGVPRHRLEGRIVIDFKQI
jgi:hypothetical protein